MSNGKREFEGDITTVEERIKNNIAEVSSGESIFDFLKQIQEDYGIHYLGDKMFELDLDGMKHVGNLASMFDILRGGNKPRASE